MLSGKEDVFTIFGIPIIKRKRQGLNAIQLTEWEMYNRLDPIGEVREDFRMAMLESLITNIAIKWAAGKKQVKLTEITDFLPQWDQPTEKEVKVQSLEEMKKALMEIARSQNKKEKAKKRGINKPPANLMKREDG